MSAPPSSILASDVLDGTTGTATPEAASTTGRAIHLAIGAVLDAPQADEDTVEAAVRHAMEAVLLPRRDRGAYVMVRTHVWAYLRRYQPGPEWDFLGAEEPLGGAIADLLFGRSDPAHRSDRLFLVDELKSGYQPRILRLARTRNQLLALLRGGLDRWGDAREGGSFLGVRIVAPASGLAYLVRTPLDLLNPLDLDPHLDLEARKELFR